MEQRLERDTVLFLSHVDILQISSLGLICCLQTVSDQHPLPCCSVILTVGTVELLPLGPRWLLCPSQ